MWFVGDVHGKIEQFNNLLERRVFPNSEPGEMVIQVGDMGMGFVFVPHFHKSVKWIRGNHDDPFHSRMHPNYLGDFGYSNEHKLFWLAGAWSIDSQWRIQQMRLGSAPCWWHDEELSQERLEDAYRLYISNKPDIVVSHEAPASIVPKVLWISSIPSIKPGDPMYDPKLHEARISGGYYQRKEKLGCVETRTSRTLQRMFEFHQPKHWVFGHYHISKEVLLNGTTFKCCAELEPYRVV